MAAFNPLETVTGRFGGGSSMMNFFILMVLALAVIGALVGVGWWVFYKK